VGFGVNLEAITKPGCSGLHVSTTSHERESPWGLGLSKGATRPGLNFGTGSYVQKEESLL
jgi:hypothetical protein